jgi:hypothetical protein
MCQIDPAIQKDVGGTYGTWLSESFQFLQQWLK